MASQFGIAARPRFVFQNTNTATRTFGPAVGNAGGDAVSNINNVFSIALGSSDTAHSIHRINASKPTLTITEIQN